MNDFHRQRGAGGGKEVIKGKKWIGDGKLTFFWDMEGACQADALTSVFEAIPN